MGKPPFTTNPEEQHQNEPFPPFDCADPRLQALITMMTRKVPAVRPTLSRIHQVLTGIVLTPQSAVAGRGLDELARVSADIVMRQQTWEAQDTAFEARGEKRNQLARAGLEILIDNVERLWGKIHMQAPNAVRNATHGPYVQLLVCNLWGAHLEVRQREPFLKPRKFPNSGWDVVVWCEILTTQDWPRYRWSSSLWYVRLPDAAEYRWYEVSYSRDVTYRGHQEEGFEPFACRMLDHADTAAGPAGQRHLIWTAFGPAAIDDEKEDEFHDRWFWLFAKACRGQLRRPRRFPIAQWPPDL
jgi:hypothetical protein